MLLWLEEWREYLPAQLMEILNPTSNGTMKKLEKRFQVGNSWRQGKVGVTLVLQVTLLGHQSISHSAWLLVSQITLIRLWPYCTIVPHYESICVNRLQSFCKIIVFFFFEIWNGQQRLSAAESSYRFLFKRLVSDCHRHFYNARIMPNSLLVLISSSSILVWKSCASIYFCLWSSTIMSLLSFCPSNSLLVS